MADDRFIYVAAIRNGDVGVHGKRYRFDTPSGDVLWINPVDIYGYDVIPDEGEEGQPEPPVAERVPHLVVTYMDDTERYYPLPFGYRIDAGSRTLAIRGGKGEPPTRIPLDNVWAWTTRNPS